MPVNASSSARSQALGGDRDVDERTASATVDSSASKLKAAAAGVALVQPGAVVGLGSGSTAELAVELLGQRVRQGLRVTGVASSERTALLARRAGIALVELNDVSQIDITLDGADEIELTTFNMIKGRGGALLREKLVALASVREVILVDETKVVPVLGVRAPVPVEVVRFAWRWTARALGEMGAVVTPRESAQGLMLTDGDNAILDCAFGALADAPRLAATIKGLPGVVEHGLFIGLARDVLVAGSHGVATHTRDG